MEIRTNNISRDIIFWHELTEDQKKEFNYRDGNKIDSGEESDPGFFEYKGDIYDIGEFMPSSMFPGWDGYTHWTYSDGVVFKFVEDYERVIVGHYGA